MCNWDAASGGTVMIARYINDTTGAGLTTIDVRFTAGQATYTSDSYCKSLAGVVQCFGGDWLLGQRAVTTVTPWGAKVKLGATYAANVVVDDGTAYTAQPKISLAPQTMNPPATTITCFPQSFGAPTMGKYCSQSSTTLVSRDGSVVQ
jgi:hypothetical protein